MSLHLIKKIHEAPLPTLRGTERIPLLEEGGAEAFIHREVLPYAPDAWYVPESVKVGYKINVTRHFYAPLCPLGEIRADILAIEKEIEGADSQNRENRGVINQNKHYTLCMSTESAISSVFNSLLKGVSK